MHKLSIAILIGALLFSLSGCGATANGASTAGTAASSTSTGAIATAVATVTVPTAATLAATDTAARATASPATTAPADAVAADLAAYADATTITLGDAIAVDGDGVAVDGTTVTITAGGEYVLSGALADGQVVVDAQDDGAVTLVLAGVDIHDSTGAPLYVAGAEETVIVLAEGTANRLSDGDSYVYADPDEDEPNATLFSKDDLTIAGSGSLTVMANYNDAMTSKDDLTIVGGAIAVEAANDGIRGRDALTIRGGTITVVANGDGLRSNNDEDAEKGVITISGGSLTVTAGEDAVQAETDLLVEGGELDLTSGGGSANGSQSNGWGSPAAGMAVDEGEDTVSMKGLKAGVDVTITGGNIVIDSADDAVHSNDSLTVSGGALTIASGDDGLHADATLTIAGGEIVVSQSYEGIESAIVTISAGNIHVTASDDGLNVSGGNDGSALGGRPGQNSFSSSGDDYLDISGGYIYADGGGDGIDVNGAITMSGGVVIVNGPTNSRDGALDYDRGSNLSGGVLVAAGSTGMAQAPDTSSTQYALMVNLDAALPAGTLIHVAAADGSGVLTFQPAKDYQSLVFSSPELAAGATYTVSTGGAADGSATDGLYVSGEYRGGSEVASLTLDGVITTYGAGGGMRGPGGGNPGGGPGGGGGTGRP